MRRLSFLCLLSLASAYLVACSDDKGTAGNGGNGGSSGSDGDAGVAGNAGAPGTAGTQGGGASGGGAAGAGGNSSAGTGGASGSSGADDVPDAGDAGDAGGQPCSGCVELVVPVQGDGVTAQDTFFQFRLSAATDMSSAVITFRLRALTPNSQFLASPFAQDADYGGFPNAYTTLSSANGFVDQDTWVDCSLDMSSLPDAPLINVTDAGGGEPDPDAFDKTRVIQFGVVVGSVPAFTGTDTIRVLIDEVTFSGVDGFPTVSFDDGVGIFEMSTYLPQAGSELIHHP